MIFFDKIFMIVGEVSNKSHPLVC